MDICPQCNKDLGEVQECDECMYTHDESVPEPHQELDFNKEESRTYSPDFSDEDYVQPNPLKHVESHSSSTLGDVYDAVQRLEEKTNDS